MTQTQQPSLQHTPWRILVVEPRPWYGAELSRQFLGQAGQVVTMTDGQLTSQQLCEKGSVACDYDLLVIQLEPQPDVSILDLLSNCLEMKIPIIGIFEELDDLSSMKWLELGLTATLAKPVSCHRLQVTVQSLLVN